MRGLVRAAIVVLCSGPAAGQTVPTLSLWEIPSLEVTTVPGGADFGSSSSVTDRDGYTYFVDTPNHTVMVISPLGATEVFAGVPGMPGADLGGGVAAPPKFNRPSGLALDSDGFLYVADTGNGTIRRFLSRHYAYPVAGHPSNKHATVDGCGERASFESPSSIKIDPDGSLFIWDNGKLRKALVHRVEILAQPADVVIKRGENATLRTEIRIVRNSGTPYRWFVGPGPNSVESRELLGHGAGGNLTVSPEQTTNYWLVYFDGCSRTVSRLATVVVQHQSRRRAVGR